MNAVREFKNNLYEYFAQIGKAISSPRRLEILDLLCQGKKSVEDLAKQAQLNVKSTSAHLKVLHAARLVVPQRSGKRVYYAVADPTVADYWLKTRAMAEQRFAEIEHAVQYFFEGRAAMEPPDRQALLDGVQRGEIVVLDVRPASEYAQGHLPNARSLPLAELEQRLAELPRNKHIAAYCRGPYCVLSAGAVRTLQRHGFKATRLSDGTLEWQAAGLPIVREMAWER